MAAQDSWAALGLVGDVEHVASLEVGNQFVEAGAGVFRELVQGFFEFFNEHVVFGAVGG